MAEVKCPYFNGVEEKGEKYIIKCGERCNLTYEDLEAYRERSEQCVGGKMVDCRAYLYNKLEAVDPELPQSYMDTDQLRELYEEFLAGNETVDSDSQSDDFENEATEPTPEETAMAATEPAPVSEARRTEAMELHQYIQAQGCVMTQAMSEVGRSLKRMRDEKLYLALGHNTFEDYTTAMLGIKQRQAYNYVKVYETYGSRFLEEHGDLGVSKLLLLANVPAPDREDFVAENNVADLSTKQLEELTEKYNKQSEQLSLLQEEKRETTATAEELTHTLALERQRYRESESKMLQQIREMDNRPIDVAVQEPDEATLERIRQEEQEKAEAALAKDREKARKEAYEQFKEQKRQAEEKANRETEKERKRADAAEARARAAEQEREAVQQNSEELIAATERARELEQHLSVAENPVSLRIQFCFEQMQRQLEQITACLAEASEENASKYRAAARAMLEQMAEEV